MNFRNRRKIKQEELGIVMLASEFIRKILVSDDHIFKPNHGIRDLIVHTIFFDTQRNTICALVSSPDIPAYVAYQTAMETLLYYSVGDAIYPIITLNYQCLEVEEVDTPEGFGGLWFGPCEEE